MDSPIVIGFEILVILLAVAVSLAVVAQRIFGKPGYSHEEIERSTAEYKAERQAMEEQPEQEEVVS